MVVKCVGCEVEFESKNGRDAACRSCKESNGHGRCMDCGVRVSSRAIRCNKCNSIARESNPRKSASGWRRYEYCGTRFRSKWEVEIAKIFRECGVPYVYEKYDSQTKSRPDFYIPNLDRFLETHAEQYGPKKIPRNCIMVSSMSHSRAAALAISMRVNPEMTKAYLRSASTQRLRGLHKTALDLCVYLRQCIEERARMTKP